MRIPGRILRGVGITLAILFLVSGCRIGPRAENHPAAHSPRGSPATVDHVTGRFVGELLEVGDDGLLLLGDGRVVFARYANIRRAEFTSVRVTVSGRTPPSLANRERLRLVSRFPYGLASERLEELLAAHGQTAVDELDP